MWITSFDFITPSLYIVLTLATDSLEFSLWFSLASIMLYSTDHKVALSTMMSSAAREAAQKGHRQCGVVERRTSKGQGARGEVSERQRGEQHW